jgi:redox-sensitive bicupin YhaK (pirin superfamily)
LAYVYHGRGTFGLDKNNNGENIEAVHLVVFNDGDQLKVQAPPDASVQFMLIAGAPFEEPIVPYGPFVMNTEAEIKQALADLRNGTFVK